MAKAAVKETLKIGEGAPGPGRPKGMPNKTTALLKDAILQAAANAGADSDDDEDGLVKYLQAQAKLNPGPFLALVGKVLPMQLSGDPDSPIRHKVEVVIVDAKG